VTEGVRVPVYNAGVLRYISTLPEGRAASLFTVSTVKEVHRMRDEIKAALYGLKEHGLADEDIEALIAQVDGTNRAIQDEGLVNREDMDVEAESESPETDAPQLEEREVDADVEDEPEDEPAPVLELDEVAVSAIAAQVVEQTGLDTFAAQMESLKTLVEGIDRRLSKVAVESEKSAKEAAGRLEALEADEDEKKRRWQADLPRRQPVQVSYRPREANAPENRGDDEKPKRGQLADVAESTLASMPRY